MTELTEDIVELQTRIQFQEDTIHKLDEVIIKQGQRLDNLVRRVAELEERIEQLAFERDHPGSASAADEKPPHY